MVEWHDLVGFAGIAMIVGAYGLLQARRLKSDGLSYSLINGAGALCVICSLLFEFNLSAFLVEVFWVLISLMGIYRCFRERRRVPAPQCEENSS